MKFNALPKMKLHYILSMILAIFCWYYTSSLTAVSSQQLFSPFKQQLKHDNDTSSSSSFSPMDFIHLAYLLTTVQLVTGSFFVMCLQVVTGKSYININTHLHQLFNIQSRSDYKTWTWCITGIFHSFGSFCTNCGFAFGSASLVQIVKLVEPIETLLLVALVNSVWYKQSFHISCKTLSAILLIILGVGMLLLGQRSGGKGGGLSAANPFAVVGALLSGICMSCRNVLTTSPRTKQSTTTAAAAAASNTVTVKDKMNKGISSFARMTTSGAIFSTIGTLFMLVFQQKRTIRLSKEIMLIAEEGSSFTTTTVSTVTLGSSITKSTIFFSCYQVASIVVLSLSSAPTHSLLNVGKRAVNILVAAVVFSDPFNEMGWFGLGTAALGGFIYSRSKSSSSSNKTKERAVMDEEDQQEEEDLLVQQGQIHGELLSEGKKSTASPTTVIHRMA